ncbi:MAG: magnesium transporter [Candidatus Omnitrophica bacterium]|nr:magnesium transporter [Candidatus Omnitrophota bacterium]
MEKKMHLITPEIKELIGEKDYTALQDIMTELLPPDTAELLQSLEHEEAIELIRSIPPDRFSEIFSYLDNEYQILILQDLTVGRLKNILNDMPSDERADLFLKITPELKKQLFSVMSEEEKKDVEKLMQYKEKTAGALMTTEFAKVNPNMTIEEATNILRKTALKRETIYYIYATDDRDRLLGVFSLKDLIVAPADKTVSEIMNSNLIKVFLHDDQEKVANVFKKYDLLALPVVDNFDNIHGIITVDDIVDVIEKEDTEDFHKMAAVGAMSNAYLKTPFSMVAKKRIGWLLLLLITYTVSAQLLEHYSYALESVIALAFFIPMLSGSAGNAGTQSATLVIRGLATGEIKFQEIFYIMKREIFMGLTLGTILGALGFLRAYLMQGNPMLGLTIGYSLALVITIATFIGSILPLILHKTGIDPAISAGPFLTTILDITSILIYFQVAKVLLGLVQ